MQLHTYSADKLLSCSHGEGIIELISGFKDGLFILDEPESALSPTSLLALNALIYEKAQKHRCQFIIVTHNPILMAITDSDFYWIGNGKVAKMDYKDSPHFSISKMFFENPSRMIENLLKN